MVGWFDVDDHNNDDYDENVLAQALLPSTSNNDDFSIQLVHAHCEHVPPCMIVTFIVDDGISLNPARLPNHSFFWGENEWTMNGMNVCEHLLWLLLLCCGYLAFDVIMKHCAQTSCLLLLLQTTSLQTIQKSIFQWTGSNNVCFEHLLLLFPGQINWCEVIVMHGSIPPVPLVTSY